MKSTIAVMSPGDMGHAVAAVLRQGGLRVISQLDGRSQRHARSPTGLASRKLRMTPPWCAQPRSCWRSWCRRKRSRSLRADRPGDRCERRQAGLRRLQRDRAPDHAPDRRDHRGRRRPLRRCRNHRAAAQARRLNHPVLCLGADAGAFARLGDFGLDVRVVDQPGQASALKMCYAA